MTDVETLMLSKMEEIRETQLFLAETLSAHTISDSKQFNDILISMALYKGQIKGFLTAVSLVSGLVGGALSLLVTYFIKGSL